VAPIILCAPATKNKTVLFEFLCKAMQSHAQLQKSS
jgi:hypothetical protein